MEGGLGPAGQEFGTSRGRPLDDDDLVARAKEGDVRSFELLVERYREPAMRVAYSVAGDDAEDAVQNGFVKAYRSLHRFRDGSPFRPWVLRIVSNEARNLRRSRGRQGALALRVAVREAVDDSQSSPEASILAGERAAVLAAAVASLPERDRLVIAYRWFVDLSEEEMATALGCRRGTVKSRLSRAHDRLRAALPADVANSYRGMSE
jgi:RNA polymerase sigma-70 factor (ECF subfamily)